MKTWRVYRKRWQRSSQPSNHRHQMWNCRPPVIHHQRIMKIRWRELTDWFPPSCTCPQSLTPIWLSWLGTFSRSVTCQGNEQLCSNMSLIITILIQVSPLTCMCVYHMLKGICFISKCAGWFIFYSSTWMRTFYEFDSHRKQKFSICSLSLAVTTNILVWKVGSYSCSEYQHYCFIK